MDMTERQRTLIYCYNMATINPISIVRSYSFFSFGNGVAMSKVTIERMEVSSFTREAGKGRWKGLKTGLALLLFAALFMIPGADLTFARNDAAQVGFATSANKVAGHGNAEQGRLPAAMVEPEEHGLSKKAGEIARPLGFPITNSMVVTWIVTAGLIIFTRVATRNMKQVPGGAQNLLEWLVAGLYGFLESIIGPHLVKRTFWFFASIFIFILSANWVGLIPGVGTIGWGHQTPNGFVVDQLLFRGANADLNLTLAMALVFFACWIVWALKEVGPVGFLVAGIVPPAWVHRQLHLRARADRLQGRDRAGDRGGPNPETPGHPFPEGALLP
jgi:F0F1-type ATP synthase membrane subunit a